MLRSLVGSEMCIRDRGHPVCAQQCLPGRHQPRLRRDQRQVPRLRPRLRQAADQARIRCHSDGNYRMEHIHSEFKMYICHKFFIRVQLQPGERDITADRVVLESFSFGPPVVEASLKCHVYYQVGLESEPLPIDDTAQTGPSIQPFTLLSFQVGKNIISGESSPHPCLLYTSPSPRDS